MSEIAVRITYSSRRIIYSSKRIVYSILYSTKKTATILYLLDPIFCCYFKQLLLRLLTSTTLLLASSFRAQPNRPLVLPGVGRRALGPPDISPSDLGPLGHHPMHLWIFRAPLHEPLAVMGADLPHWTKSLPICSGE